MKNRVKILVALLVAIVVFSGIGFYFYQRGNSDVKEVTVEIISKRDDFNGKENFKTNHEYLGDLLKEENIVSMVCIFTELKIWQMILRLSTGGVYRLMVKVLLKVLML